MECHEKHNKPNLEILIKEHLKLNAINDFYKSLVESTKECGGSTAWITPETTIAELADKLAVNDIRFIYTGEKDEYLF